MKKIINFFKTAFSNKYLNITITIIVILLIIFNLKTCQNLKEEKFDHKKDVAIYENNIEAMNDSLVEYYDKKMDRMITKKTSMIIKNVKDLQKYNKEMYEDFKYIENLISGIKSDVSINIPTLIGESSTPVQDENDTTKFNIPFSFNYSDDGLTQTLDGYSRIQINNNFPFILGSTLETNKFNIKLRYALTEDDNKYIVKAFSPSPLVKFDELDGALTIDKVMPETSNNNWAFGPYIGFGVNTNIVGEDFRFGWSAGASVTYNIFSKTKRKNKK